MSGQAVSTSASSGIGSRPRDPRACAPRATAAASMPAAPVGHPVEGGVVEGQRDAVRGDPDVGLEVAVAEIDGALERGHRVLVAVGRETAMGEGVRRGPSRKAVRTWTARSRAAACADGGPAASRGPSTASCTARSPTSGWAARRSADEVAHLAVADVVGAQLGRGELHPLPLLDGLAVLLEAALGHQLDRVGLVEVVAVEADVEDRVERSSAAASSAAASAGRSRARRPRAVAARRPSAPRRRRPSPRRTSRWRRPRGRRRAAVAVGVHQLQRVAGHRLVHGQVVQHVRVVLAEERGDALRRPVLRASARRRTRSAAAAARAGRTGCSRRRRRRGRSRASR